jgi:hypothetical protein
MRESVPPAVVVRRKLVVGGARPVPDGQVRVEVTGPQRDAQLLTGNARACPQVVVGLVVLENGVRQLQAVRHGCAGPDRARRALNDGRRLQS